MKAHGLARLISQQSRDDAGETTRPARERLATDLGPAAWDKATADPRPDPEPWTWLDRAELRPRVRIGLTPTWTAEVVGYDPKGGQVCPACHDATLRESEVCLVCSSTRAAPRRWAMMDRGERAAILRGPAPLAGRAKKAAQTRRERRAAG